MPTEMETATATAIKVLIVDDHPAIREALALRIAARKDLQVCGEACDLVDALQLVIATRPDVAIIDVALKTGSGIDLIKRIKERDETVRILVWSMYDEDMYAERAMRAGAQGYINKQQATEQIMEAIDQIIDGKVYLSPAMKEKLLHRAVGEGNVQLADSPLDSLSDRELEVLHMIGRGLRTPQIAAQLHLSPKTVETYRDRIRRKLDLSDGTELTMYAVKYHLENG